MSKKFFSLGLYSHRLWGMLIIPVILKKRENEIFYSPDITVFYNEKNNEYHSLSHTEKEIVKIIDEYSDQHLFKYFSKHKNLKEFQNKIDQESIDKFIRPYIEKRLLKILEIVRHSTIKIFLRENAISNIFDEDFLTLFPSNAKAVFSFARNEEGSEYQLKILYEEKEISIIDEYTDIVSNQPAIIRLNNHLLFITDIEAKKIKPFFTRKQINIPHKTELQYFKVFVKNIVSQYKVKAEGFEIRTIHPEKKAIISLEKGLQNNAVLVLRFNYGDKSILANAGKQVFVDFHNHKEQFLYEKYHRDPVFEASFHDLLNDTGLISFDMVNYERKNVRKLSFRDQLYLLVEWINRNSEELFESGIILEQKLSEDFYRGNYDLNLNSKLENDWFDVNAIISIGEFKIPFLRFRQHILKGKREYLLPNEQIFVIPNEWFSQYKDFFQFSKDEGESLKIHKQHFQILDKLKQGTNSRDIDHLELLNNRENLSPSILPEKLAADLRPYQVEGFTWLRYLQQNNLGGCLADDMGLGKTLQTICLLLKNKEEFVPPPTEKNTILPKTSLFGNPEATQPSLIVVPATLIHNWKNEIKRFAPSLKILSYIGQKRSVNLSRLQFFDVIISSYHTIRQDIEKISAFHFHYIILDESQVIKNPSSKIYKAMQILNSDHRLVLTGTPIENSLTDLWSQMNFVNTGLLGNLNYFRKEYVFPIEKKNDPQKQDKLKKLINPFILRRTKQEVAKDLPEISRQVIYCNMTEEQRHFYEEEKSGIRNSIFERIEKEGIEKTSIIVLRGLTRLRQISNHPEMVDENYQGQSGKFNEIIRNIENIISEGHKVLIFSSFVKHLNLIKKSLDQKNICHSILTGESRQREEIVKDFQEKEECKVFLISLKAGGVGLNLTAADYVFVIDPWWNPASEEQAINRAHRIGQDKNVFVYRFISVDSIEEKIQKLQEKKAKLAESFVQSNNPMKNISKKDLEGLFE